MSWLSPPSTRDHTAELVAVALVVARVGFVDHAPFAADAVLALGLSLMWFFLGSGRRMGVLGLALLAPALLAVVTSRGVWISGLSLSVVIGSVAAVAVAAGPARRGVVTGLAVAGLAHSATAIAQRFVTWPDALLRKDELELPQSVVDRLASMRTIGLSISPDLGAAVAVAGGVAALALACDSSIDKAWRRGSVVVVVACVVALFCARSYGAFAAVALGVVVFVVLQRSWRAAVVLGVAGAAVGAGVAVAAAARGSHALLLSAHERLQNWRVALDAFVDAPLVGHGLFRFAPAYLERRSPDDNITRYAHSMVMQWLAETGVVGVIGAVVAAVVVVKAFVAGPRSLVRNVCAAGACALLARGCIDYDFEVGQTAMLSSLVLGLALFDPPRTPPTQMTRSPAVGVIVVVAIVVAALFAVRAAVPALVVRRDLDVAFAAVAAGADSEATLAPFVEESPPAALRLAVSRAQAGDGPGAARLVDLALARDPGNAMAWRLKHAFALEAGDAAAASAAAAGAARWHVALGPNQ